MKKVSGAVFEATNLLEILIKKDKAIIIILGDIEIEKQKISSI